MEPYGAKYKYALELLKNTYYFFCKYPQPARAKLVEYDWQKDFLLF